MRKFWLHDGSNSFPLNGESLVWFVYPTGLGYKRKSDHANLGNGFFSASDDDFDMLPINGEFRFLRPAYATFETFVNWLFSAKELTLIYQPLNVQYKRAISVASLGKSELEGGDWLVCPVVFDPKTPWYTEELLTFSTDGNASVASVAAGGQIGATVMIYGFSEVTDPHIEIKGGALFHDVYADAKAVCTTQGFAYCNHYNNAVFSGGLAGGAEYSLLPYTDLNKPVFGRSKHGNALKISVTPAGSYIGNVLRWWMTV